MLLRASRVIVLAAIGPFAHTCEESMLIDAALSGYPRNPQHLQAHECTTEDTAATDKKIPALVPAT